MRATWLVCVALSLVAACAPGSRTQGGDADCIASPARVGGHWLSEPEAFPEGHRAAAALLAEAYGATAGDFLATVDETDTGLVFHLWHRTAFAPEHCNLVGNPGGLCRDVHLAPAEGGGWEVVAIYFWQ
jgi:hypothetical protein